MTDSNQYGLRRFAQWASLVVVAVAVSVVGWFLTKGILGYAQAMGVFDLRHIEVRGNNILTRAEVVDAMTLPLVGNIFDVDLSAIKERVEVLNYVYGVRLGRKLPHILFIDIIENQPIAYVAAADYYILTEEGKALPLPHKRFELELPTVSGVDSALNALDLGHVRGHEQLRQAWKILNYFHSSFPYLYQDISELVFTDNGEITLYMAETSTAVRLGGRDLERRVALLDAFLLALSGKRSLMDYSYIDLRYERQVVVRERA